MEFEYYIRSYQILIISLIITFRYPDIFLDYYSPYIYKRNISINLYKNHSIFYIQKKQKDSFSNNDKIKKNPLPFGNLETWKKRGGRKRYRRGWEAEFETWNGPLPPETGG